MLHSISSTCLVLSLIFGTACRAAELPPGNEIAAQSKAPQLETLFHQDELWSGGDGAYSLSIAPEKSIWFFGDSFIGTIRDGKRQNNQMIHNAVGVQDMNAGKMQFYFSHAEKAGSYFSDGQDYWLWPGDSAFHDKKIYAFAKRVKVKAGKSDPFGFVWFEDELLVIDNPNETPDNWQCRHLPLPFTNRRLHFGTACIVDQGNLYVLGMAEKKREALISRIRLDRLAEMDASAFEFLAKGKSAGQMEWTNDVNKAAGLFGQSAAEGSISKIPGGFVCIYQQNSMGSRIVARTAKSPAGPWSEEKLIHTISEADSKRGFSYAAKAHPEQPAAQGQLCLSYCINPGNLEAHTKDPQAYFPRIIYVTLPEMSEEQKSGNN